MSSDIRLEAADGRALDAYEAMLVSSPRELAVIVQETFGVTRHIRSVVDRYAAEGYRAIAPAMFDRLSNGIVLDYSDVETGRSHMQLLRSPETLADVEAAIGHVTGARRLVIVGFCWAAQLPMSPLRSSKSSTLRFHTTAAG